MPYPSHGVLGTASIRRPMSFRMRLTYRRDLYGVSFLPYLSYGRAILGAGGGGW